MKRLILILLITAFILSFFAACNKNQSVNEDTSFGKIIYVSTNGNDDNDGSANSPVATFSGAVNAMRSYRNINGLPKGGIKIEFASGIYDIRETINLTADDSGTADSPIVISGAKNAEVVFNGGVFLKSSDFKPADDGFKTLLQTEEAKQNIVMIDLSAIGCFDLDDTKNYENETGYRQELFVNGKRQDVARWPNDSYCHPEKIDATNTVIDDQGNELGKIYITEEQASAWRNTDNIRFYGYPYYDWSTVRLNEIALSENEPALIFPVNVGYGLGDDCLYYVYNIPQELDASGEYYWDTDNNILYYWPEKDFENAEISFSQFYGTPVTLSNCSYITFDNLSAKYFRNGFISVIGDHNTISNCCISSMAGIAAISLRGDYNIVKGCLLHDLSGKGIAAISGNTETQTLGNTVITDNIIYEWQQLITNKAGIEVYGCGFLVAHNELHDSPHVAIEILAGQCIIEYNLVYNCLKESSDAGAIHTMGYFNCYDNIYRYNCVHDIKDTLHENGWGNAVYFDCFGRFGQAYGNLFYNIAGTCLCGASGFMDFHDNICINVGEPINIVYWGPSESPDYYSSTMMTYGIRLYNYHSQLWKYTSSRTLLFSEVNYQDDNHSSFDLPLSPAHFNIYNNVRYIDIDAEYKSFDEAKEDPYISHTVRGIQWAFDLSEIRDNVCYFVDPGFTDYENGNYTIKEDSRIFRDLIGFKNPDLSTVGTRPSKNAFN